MNIIEKSSNGISQVSADAKLMSNRKVFIEGEINAESACEFVKKNTILIRIRHIILPIGL